MHRMPEYAALVDGSRKMAKVAQPLRAVRTEFALPVSSDPSFLYTILGGRLDPQSPLVGVIKVDGGVEFRQAGAL